MGALHAVTGFASRDPHGLAAAIDATVADAVRSCLADQADGHRPRTRRLVTRADAAEYLGVSLSQIDAWARRGLIRRRRFDGTVRFDVADLDAWVDSWDRS